MSAQLTITDPRQLYPLFGDLTMRQNSFVNHYLEQGGNGAQAARLAGYAGDGDQLAVVASRLLASVKVRAELQRRLGKSIASADEVLERLTKQSRADIGQILQPDGSFDIKRARQRHQTDLLKKLKFDKDTGRVTEIELHDAKDATKTLAQFHGLLIERSESVNVNLNVMGEDERQLRLAELAAKLTSRQGSQDVVADSSDEHNP